MRETFIQWNDLDGWVSPSMLAGHEFHDYIVDGDPVATAMIKGTEIHFAVDPKWRGRLIQRQRAREFLSPLLERNGFLTTTTDGIKSAKFLAALGFVETWCEGPYVHHMLCTLPFSNNAE